jgi:Glutamate decarboxylase and related PLP-dependent proteins
MIVTSAPNFPYGVIDPIEEIGAIAVKHKVWLHVDACVGGMILPFLSMAGINVKKWDFTVPGVTSISVDLHKYGFTPKGSSVILYRNRDFRRYQLYVNANWPGYPMSNVGMQSTKSAAPMAASWDRNECTRN